MTDTKAVAEVKTLAGVVAELRITGRIVGPEPANEAGHFYTCVACGQAVDMRDLGQVFHHEELDHDPHNLDG